MKPIVSLKLAVDFMDFCDDDLDFTYNLHCSSFFWFNQLYIQDPKR